jgi:hypothetical protein
MSRKNETNVFIAMDCDCEMKLFFKTYDATSCVQKLVTDEMENEILSIFQLSV